MIYLDANIFIYAALNEDAKGEACTRLLKRVEKGEVSGLTSYLTLEEVAWVISKRAGKEAAVKACSDMLSIQNLRFVPVDSEISWFFLELMKSHGLRPSDAIHAASAISHSVKEFVSEDADFDKVKEIKRTTPWT
ncbi:MAG TPA: type II toxin-antitoxin system VapC family toxin [archaeon]|nr:type II toxin-antitoxin system VapC family toxin [archaeon]HLD80887.1 type II toxin-antitoxin system VapC family toxin [archaeon]